jgi:hypothetical protein
MFVRDYDMSLLQIKDFSIYSGFLNQTDRHDITEIWLKMALSPITPTSLKLAADFKPGGTTK